MESSALAAYYMCLFRLEHDYEVVDVEEPPELPDPRDQNLAQGLDELSIDRPEVGEEAKEREDVDECLVCSERLPLVTFLPCGDKIVCTDCRCVTVSNLLKSTLAFGFSA